jgi:tRNA U34 2-thiouridine synthase MnmA/TrmU
MGHGGDGARRFVVAVDVPGRRVTVGSGAEARVETVPLEPATLTACDRPLRSGQAVLAQVSAHGPATPATVVLGPVPAVRFSAPERPVAPGQTVAFYDPGRPDVVLGSAVAGRWA